MAKDISGKVKQLPKTLNDAFAEELGYITRQRINAKGYLSMKNISTTHYGNKL